MLFVLLCPNYVLATSRTWVKEFCRHFVPHLINAINNRNPNSVLVVTELFLTANNINTNTTVTIQAVSTTACRHC